jgi:hypothetical protein
MLSAKVELGDMDMKEFCKKNNCLKVSPALIMKPGTISETIDWIVANTYRPFSTARNIRAPMSFRNQPSNN